MKRILIVDDVKRIRGIYNRLLTAEGFEVIEASSAGEAQEILKRERIDLILLDIKMPEADGSIVNISYEAVKLFRKKCKVIVTSVYSLGEQKQIITEASDYYDKSQGIDILLAKVREVLKDG